MPLRTGSQHTSDERANRTEKDWALTRVGQMQGFKPSVSLHW